MKNPARRDGCRLDLLRFLVSYFPNSTGLKPFSDDHLRFISRLQSTILEGGREIAAVYRGFAKTTIGELACLWALLYGHSRFAVLLAADMPAAEQNLDSIKSELEHNDLLLEDFPEVCHGVRALEGKAQRTHSQTVDGQLTGIEWTADQIVFPSVQCEMKPVASAPRLKRKRTGASSPVPLVSPSSGACVRTKGLLSCNRGMTHKMPDGRQVRPDFVMIDDPQTDASARSPAQCRARIRKLYSTVLRLAGHSSKLAVFLAGTVIENGDMLDELLDRERHPSFRGERVPMVRTWSRRHEDFWLGEYANIRKNFNPLDPEDRERSYARATNLYKRHKHSADEGCRVSWDFCYSQASGEISAIQHAYNILLDDGPEVFAAECQQSPARPEDRSCRQASARDLLQREPGEARGLVPQWADELTCGLDVQATAIYWLVAAWQRDSFRGQVVDWGVWPEQPRPYFQLSELRHTLATRFPGSDTEGGIYQGLAALLPELAGRRFARPDGSEYAIQLMLCDSGGTWTQTVYDACRASGLGPRLLPSKGRGIGAKDRPLSEWKTRPGNRLGREWLIARASSRLVPLITFDANYWKSAVNDAMLIPAGTRGSLTFPSSATGSASVPRSARQAGPSQPPGASPRFLPSLELLLDQLLAERGVLVTARGRSVIEFACPSGRDNHLGDCLVQSAVAASVLGCQRLGQAPPRSRRRPDPAPAAPPGRRRPVKYL